MVPILSELQDGQVKYTVFFKKKLLKKLSVTFALVKTSSGGSFHNIPLILKEYVIAEVDLEVVHLFRTNCPSEPREPNLMRYILNLQSLDIQALELASYYKQTNEQSRV